MADLDPLTPHRSAAQTAVLDALRVWAVGYTELSRHLAAWFDLPGSDADALGHIVRADDDGHPLSPVGLSRRIGMTSGATTVLLNRLETAGHVRRSREHADRRRVTLRPEARTRERARAFFAASGTEIASAVQSAGPDELDTVLAFLTRIAEATSHANTRLRERPLTHGSP